MAKYRSTLDWKVQYESNKKGYGSGLELYPFIKEETSAGVFNPPSVGTQGKSESGNTATTDISGSSNDNFNINVDGEGVVNVQLNTVGANTADLIAEEMESSINAALELGEKDARVWVEYVTDHYVIWSQKTGEYANVVITEGATGDISAELELGVGNGGTETAGTYSDDWIYVKSAALNYTQENENSAHRSGRQLSSVYKKKKMVEGSLETYCLLGAAGDTDIYMPDGLKTILRGAFGHQEVDTPQRAVFNMKQPHASYFTLCHSNNMFSQVGTGCYIKTWNLELAGDDAASISMDLKGRDVKATIPAKIQTGGLASSNITLVTGDYDNIEPDSLVMVVATDGKTVLAGGDGSLKVVSRDKDTGSVSLSAAVNSEDDGFLVPFFPIYGFNIPADNAQIATDLTGTISFDGGSTVVDTITSASVSVDPQLTDLDGYYGADGNRGFVDGSRAEITLSVTTHLTGKQANLIMKAKRYKEFSFEGVVGFPDGQKMIVRMPRVVFSVPAVEIPENGPVEVTLEGKALQTLTGAMDAIEVEFLAV